MASAVAKRVGQDHRVLMCDRNGEHLAAVVAQLRLDGLDAYGQVCDVTDPVQVEALAQASETHGPVKALLHVVGLSPSMGDFSAVMNVNIVGAALMANAMLPRMSVGGAAVFISSMSSRRISISDEMLGLLDDPLAAGFIEQIAKRLDNPDPSMAYRLSKAALNRMCERLAFSWGKRGNRILSVSPGMMATPMGALEFERSPHKWTLLDQTPLSREGSMLEIAEAVAFLASSGASFISGTDILVDGGVIASLKHEFGTLITDNVE